MQSQRKTMTTRPARRTVITRQIDELVRIREEAENTIAFLIDALDEAEGDADEEPWLGWALPSEWGGQYGRRFLGGRDDLEDEHDGREDDGDDEPSLASCNVMLGRVVVAGNPIWPDQTVVVDPGMDQRDWMHLDDRDLEEEFAGYEPDLAVTDREAAFGSYSRLARAGHDEGDDEREIDHAERGIADHDAMTDPEITWDTRFGFDGSGRAIARRMLREVGKVDR